MTIYYRDSLGTIALSGVVDVAIVGDDVYITASDRDITIRINQLTEITEEEGEHENL